MRIPKKQSYLKKTKEIEQERDKAAAQLGDIHQQISEAKSELSLLEKKKTLYTSTYEIHDSEAVRLKDIIDSKNTAINSLELDHQNKVKDFQIKEKFYLDRLSDLEIQVTDNEKKSIDKIGLDIAIADLNLRFQDAKNNLGDVVDCANMQRLEIKTERIVFESEKKIFQKIIDETNKRSQQNEKDRGTLEIWIRRLQQYYDDSNINLKIFNYFGLKDLSENEEKK